MSTHNITKHQIISAVAKQTRQRKHEVQQVLEAYLDYCTEALLAGGKIELQDYWVMEVKTIERQGKAGRLRNNGRPVRQYQKLTIRASKRLRELLKA